MGGENERMVQPDGSVKERDMGSNFQSSEKFSVTREQWA